MRIDEPTTTKMASCELEEPEAVILIGDGKVMFTLPDEQLREQTLIRMGELYHIQFSPAEITKFKETEIIGEPMSELKNYLNRKDKIQAFFEQPGIQGGELVNWIAVSNNVCRTTKHIDLGFAIDADKAVAYPLFEKVTDILGSQRIFKFSLVTTVKRAVYHK